MFSKLRLIIFCIVASGISCYAINFSGYNVFAQAEKPAESQVDTPAQEVEAEIPHEVSQCKFQGDEDKGCCKKNRCPSAYHTYHAACHHEDSKDHADSHKASSMLKLAHDAKKELLKEKMKVKLEEKMGKKLDKVADLLVNAMFEEYQAMREGKKRDTELEKKLEEIFSQKEGKE